MKECFLPISSFQLQRNVPIWTFVVLVPANPFTILPDGRSGPTKSSLMCEIHPEHRLSIPIVSESVSKCVILSVAIVAFACIARTVMARAVPLDRQPNCFRLFRCCLLRTDGFVTTRIQSPRLVMTCSMTSQHFIHVSVNMDSFFLILGNVHSLAFRPSANA